MRLSGDVDVVRNDVWVAAMCVGAAGERAVRVVRVDPGSESMRLAGLGAGTYVVRASALSAPNAVSPRLAVGSGTTVTTLTLASTPRPIASLSAQGGGPALVDAGAAGLELAADIRLAGSGSAVIGRLEGVLRPRADGADGFEIAARVVGVACDGAWCPRLSASGVEVRVTRNGTPSAFAAAPVGSPSPTDVAPGASIAVGAIALPGRLNDPALALQITLFGSVGSGSTDAGTVSASDVATPPADGSRGGL